MNGKKAKKLRQLVRHLTEKSGMGWVDYEDQQFRAFVPVPSMPGSDDGIKEVVHVTRKLKPDCGRAVYQQMKKAA